jgi:hypothetical protein
MEADVVEMRRRVDVNSNPPLPAPAQSPNVADR